MQTARRSAQRFPAALALLTLASLAVLAALWLTRAFERSVSEPRGSASGAIAIAEPWARAAPRGSPDSPGTSAVYLEIRNTSAADDTLLGASSAAADAVEVHRTTLDNGVMRMQPAGRVVVPAKGAVKLEPGGLHIMLIGLRQDLTAGGEVVVTLQFERAGEVEVRAPVRSVNRAMEDSGH